MSLASCEVMVQRMSSDHYIEPVFEISEGQLLIKVPLEQIAAAAEASTYSPVRVRDAKELTAFLIRYLKNSERSEDVGELLENAILHILEDAAFLGEGALSIIEDIPLLIDRMWQADRHKILIDYGAGPLGKTPRDCLTEAIRAACKCERAAALEWLRRGTDMSEEVAQALQANWEEALEYAVARYGPELSNRGRPEDLL